MSNSPHIPRTVYDWIRQHPDLPESIAAQIDDWAIPHRRAICNEGHYLTFDNTITGGSQPRRCKICREGWMKRNNWAARKKKLNAEYGRSRRASAKKKAQKP
jgi:hypothetical protein